jgi:pimeloyl-ACP methyl ester carboxylesterase
VRKLVAISALVARSGADAQFWEWMRNARLENMPIKLQEAYRAVAPHPENLRTFHDKAAQRMRDFRDVPQELLRAIQAPTLVVQGDADVVRPEHGIELFRTLPHAELAILPGTDHMSIMGRADALVPIVERFLDASPSGAR